MNKKIFRLSLTALLLGGCAHDGDNLPEVVQIKKIDPYHRVKGDDTVESIAKQYGMKRSELIKLNKLEPPYHLYEGQRLIVTPKVSDNEEVLVEPDITVSTIGMEDMPPIKSDDLNSDPNVSTNETDNTVADDAKNDLDPKPTVEAHEYEWPIANGKSKVSQHFDGDGGIILDASVGTPVKSIATGTVVIAGVPSGDAAAYGVTVVVKHTAKKTMSIYSNLKEAKVSVGQKVQKGTIIGKVGQTGSIAKKPQLYFEVNDLSGKGRHAIDPEKLLG